MNVAAINVIGGKNRGASFVTSEKGGEGRATETCRGGGP